jgi:hypothetical protein
MDEIVFQRMDIEVKCWERVLTHYIVTLVDGDLYIVVLVGRRVVCVFKRCVHSLKDKLGICL